MTRTKRFDKRYLAMLWIGLALWLSSMLVSFIMELTGNAPDGQQNLMDMGKVIFQSHPIAILLLFCFFQPILEELSFRLWGVGKTWMTVVCLVLMAAFSAGEMGLWGLLFVALFIVVWIMVKDKVQQNWINAVITSACFALCHTSGFSGFSFGMVLGLLDIFGMALVMCWLTINISFWLSCLLHVLNNSAALLIPLLFLPDPVTVTTGGMTTTIEPLKPFAENSELIGRDASLYSLDSTTTEFYLVGEPAQIAMRLAEMADTTPKVYYDWKSKDESMEERVVYHVSYAQPQMPDYKALLTSFLESAKKYADDEGMTFDTTSTYLKEVWLVYDDGTEALLTPENKDASKAIDRVINNSYSVHANRLIEEYVVQPDSSIGIKYYCLEQYSPMKEQLSAVSTVMDGMYGFRIELRDAVEVKLITIK